MNLVGQGQRTVLMPFLQMWPLKFFNHFWLRQRLNANCIAVFRTFSILLFLYNNKFGRGGYMSLK